MEIARRSPRDPRLVNPFNLDVVKVDSIYQIKREDLFQYELHEFPFNEVNNGNRYFCNAYDYMSILTDGGINQDNVAKFAQSGHSVCMIEFDDHETYVIKAETGMTPIPLINKQWFRFWNELGELQSDSEGLESGYGNLKILLHNWPYIWQVQKENPQFCNTDPLAAQASEQFWVGINKTNAAHITMIPYLPPNYGCIRICFYAETSDLTLRVVQYCCINGTYSCYDNTFDAGTDCLTIPCCSQRILFRVSNTHALSQLTYCLDVKFIEGCGGVFDEPQPA